MSWGSLVCPQLITSVNRSVNMSKFGQMKKQKCFLKEALSKFDIIDDVITVLLSIPRAV